MSSSPTDKISSIRRALKSKDAVAVAFFAALCIALQPAAGHAATTAGTAMPWETPLQTIADSITGPVAKAIGVIAIAVTGLGFAFSEGGSALRKGLGIVFGLAIAFTASTFLTTFFAVTGGAVF